MKATAKGGTMPSAEYLVVAFPVAKAKNAAFRKFDQKSGLQTNLTRLIGRSLTSPGVTKSVLRCAATVKKLGVEARLIATHLKHNVAVLIIELPAALTSTQIEKLSRRTSLRLITDALDLEIASEAAVDGVVGFVGNNAARIERLPNYWLTEQADQKSRVFALELCTHLVARVAIERELLTWATSQKRFPLSSIWSGVAGYRVRRWPVNLLSDRLQLTEKLDSMRTQFNLPNVRKETIARSSSWWVSFYAVVGLSIAITPLIVGLLK